MSLVICMMNLRKGQESSVLGAYGASYCYDYTLVKN